MSKFFIFLVKTFWATFIDILRNFTGHTGHTYTKSSALNITEFVKQIIENIPYTVARWNLLKKGLAYYLVNHNFKLSYSRICSPYRWRLICLQLNSAVLILLRDQCQLDIKFILCYHTMSPPKGWCHKFRYFRVVYLDMLHWNIPLWLVVPSRIIIFNQSECFNSAKRSSDSKFRIDQPYLWPILSAICF